MNTPTVQPVPPDNSTPSDGLSRRKMLKGVLAFAGVAGVGGIGSRALADSTEKEAPRKKTDFVIIGGGFSGIAAAKRLMEKDASFILLEAQDRLGGRGATITIPGGGFIDQGAQFIGTAQDRIIALADSVGVKRFPATPRGGKSVLIYEGKRIEFDQTTMQGVPEEWLAAATEFSEVEAKLDAMAETIDPNKPWAAEKALEWDSMTLDTWVHENIKSSKAKYLFKTFIHGYLSAEPRDFSLLHCLFYIKAGGKTVELHETGLSERFAGGVQQICDKVAAQFSDRVVLNSPVRAIDQTDKSKVTVTCVHGDIYECKRVIVAMSPGMTGKLAWNPPLPASRIQLTQRIPMGSAIKCHCVYPTAFWLDKGLSGFVYFDDQPISFLLDNTPPEGKPGIIVAFLEAQAARDYGDRPHDEVKKLMVDLIVKHLGEEGANPTAYYQTNWAAEPWAGGCYAGIFPTGVWTSYPNALLAPVDRVHWAGTETANRWFAYMDGAVRSGERAAEEVMHAESSKSKQA